MKYPSGVTGSRAFELHVYTDRLGRRMSAITPPDGARVRLLLSDNDDRVLTNLADIAIACNARETTVK